MKLASLLAGALLCVVATSAQATVFFTDGFDYFDGDLTTVSSDAWVSHSGDPPDIQVVSGNAVVRSPGSQDDNRSTGSVMGETDIWYYATSFSFDIDEAANINEDYFIHLKDDGTFFFNARLLPTDPVAAGDFSLAIAASTLDLGRADWTSDFTFGEQITAVVEWDKAAERATLWVNPVDSNSPSISDDEPGHGVGRLTEALGLRQDSGGNGNTTTIDIVSIGDSFDEVLAAVSGGAEVLGDYNDTGLVEQGDLDLVLLNWGDPWPPTIPAWINQQPTDDSKIDQNDLDGVLLNWGNSSTSTSSVVPEPSALVLLIAGLLLGCRARQ